MAEQVEREARRPSLSGCCGEELDHVLQGYHHWEQRFGLANYAPAADRAARQSALAQTMGDGCCQGEGVLPPSEELQPT